MIQTPPRGRSPGSSSPMRSGSHSGSSTACHDARRTQLSVRPGMPMMPPTGVQWGHWHSWLGCLEHVSGGLPESIRRILSPHLVQTYTLPPL